MKPQSLHIGVYGLQKMDYKALLLAHWTILGPIREGIGDVAIAHTIPLHESKILAPLIIQHPYWIIIFSRSARMYAKNKKNITHRIFASKIWVKLKHNYFCVPNS